ncbi:Leucine-rich repeat-containing protein 20 [Toxocara canis]|uniref:Leucine-rich repeat-containing protein 20 n=2 Tax=Toxocara canis TaxID=6265 RepID=A0A0B2VUX7_TOXCA|nr:Leucine-rich repeat-containing protein 20 [Toxocara canis]VDM36801.1 unnamed protein product [Toxocara canis]
MASAAGKGVTQVMHRCEAAKSTGYLDLSDCSLMYIADAIYLVLKGYDINKCNLRNNNLKKIPRKLVERFSNMIMFNAEGNKIEEFPEEMAQWIGMKGMNIANNKLSTFPLSIYSMKQLSFLDISGNSIEEIDVDRLYSSLPHLMQLTLTGNPLNATTKSKLEEHSMKPTNLKLVL